MSFFRRVAGLKAYHHFSAQSGDGVVHVRKCSDSPVETSDLHKLLDNSMAEVIKPVGLSAKRQWYLHEQIRQFYPEQVKDIHVVCPQPQTPKDMSNQAGPSGLQAEVSEVTPPAKKGVGDQEKGQFSGKPLRRAREARGKTSRGKGVI